MTKRHVPLSAAVDAELSGFVDAVDEHLTAASDDDLADAVFEVVAELHGDRELARRYADGDDLTPIERARAASYHPEHVTLESEYYAELEVQREEWARSKPLQWLWRQFDNSPLADNVDFALAFRQMLADHLFAEVGEGCRFFRGITFTYGHNLAVGDNVVVHDDVHLDDRGRLTVGDRASLADGVHVYTHDHDLVDQTQVTNYHTVVGDDARLTFDAMVRAGCRVGENALVGARGVVQSDVPDHHVAVGMPAESIAVKPGWESVAAPVDDEMPNRREERVVAYDVDPDSFEPFDEFERERSPPDV